MRFWRSQKLVWRCGLEQLTRSVIGQEILVLCRVLVPDTEMVSPAYILWSMKSIANPLFFNVTLPREIVPFLSDDPLTELLKRQIIDFI